MADDRAGFPRRDADGRVAALADLTVAAFAGLIVGLAVLALLDGVFAAFGSGRFGQSSGWLATVLPVWLFVEEFRAWRGVPGRIGVVLIVGVLAVGGGLAAASLTGDLPHLLSGAVGAIVFVLLYAVLWFFGIRWLARVVGEKGVSR